MGEFGIKIVDDVTDVSSATTVQTLLSSKYELMKLDRNNNVSFQNIRIFFANEPPAPDALNTTVTLLYKFEHGYKYTPAIWSYCKADGVTVGGVTGTVYFTDNGTVGGSTTSAGASYATVQTGADETYCYIYITKFTGVSGVPIYMAGSALNFRFYVFAQDVGV